LKTFASNFANIALSAAVALFAYALPVPQAQAATTQPKASSKTVRKAKPATRTPRKKVAAAAPAAE